ncbi:MAG: UDP-galactopyranose mutase [Tannerellaceae bacterium]|nr:UDP-galactopyranose mutase [Tannerellaceae bacterium]
MKKKLTLKLINENPMGNPTYDLLLVGSGLYNAIIANEAAKNGLKCLVIDKRSHPGGNVYTEKINDINVHTYGPHIFHTKDKEVWEYMSGLCTMNHFILTPLAYHKGKLYNLPFNMHTFYQLWGLTTPEAVIKKLQEQNQPPTDEDNFENKAISLVGKDVYNILIKGYTEKQWGRSARELSSGIIKRLPLRFVFNNNYFDDPYQGIPVNGYTKIIEDCFKQCDILLNTDFTENRSLQENASLTVYTGMIDEYYDYTYGTLEYRSLRFETEIPDCSNYQGAAVVNYTEKEVPYTRIIEHKHFEFGNQPTTVITKEYPLDWQKGLEPYYPVQTSRNEALYAKYSALAAAESQVIFGGRLGLYKYLNMDQIVRYALDTYQEIRKKLKTD